MLPGLSSRSLPSRQPAILLVTIFFSLLVKVAIQGEDDSSQTTSQLISKANQLLSSGQAHQALKLYDQALERNPDDYLTTYKKATTQFSLGQYHQSSASFYKVLELKDDFEQAKVQLVKILLKLGDYDGCDRQLKSLQTKKTSQKRDKDVEEAITQLADDLKSVKATVKSLEAYHRTQKWEKCVEEGSAATRISPQSTLIRRLRSDCHLLQGHLQEALGDLTRVAHMTPSDPAAAMRVSLVSYIFIAEPIDRALPPIKQCLHSDPESKPCKSFFRRFKAFEKALSKVKNFIDSNGYRSAIKLLKPKNKPSEGLIAEVLEIISASQKVDKELQLGEALIPAKIENLERHSNMLNQLYAYTCQAYLGLDEYSSSQNVCETLHAQDAENVWGLAGLGEQKMAKEEWQEAVEYLKKAYEKTNGENSEIESRLRRAQKGLKISKQKDYYQVLNVPRNVDARTLKKAYKKATLKAHPDKGGSEAKMTALNAAYEVLSDPKKRAQYDNGDDPSDPMSRQGGSPFEGGFQANHPIFQQFFQQGAGGGNPFGGAGGGGQTFTFRWG